MSNISWKILVIAILAGVLIISGIVGYFDRINSGKTLGEAEIGEKIITFINENFLQEGVSASLLGIEKKDGLYHLKIAVEEEEFEAYATETGRFLFFQPPIDLDKEGNNQDSSYDPAQMTEERLTLGNFSVSDEEVCRENEKPLVYFFGSQACPYCLWQQPVIAEVAVLFGDNIIFRDNMDSDKDSDVFYRYSSGYVPTLVLGCRYYRIGSGEKDGKENEIANLTALICKLTQSQPASACSPVQELINQID